MSYYSENILSLPWSSFGSLYSNSCFSCWASSSILCPKEWIDLVDDGQEQGEDRGSDRLFSIPTPEWIIWLTITTVLEEFLQLCSYHICKAGGVGTALTGGTGAVLSGVFKIGIKCTQSKNRYKTIWSNYFMTVFVLKNEIIKQKRIRLEN